jgi:hypothetical protein
MPQIICPKCQHAFEPTDALRDEIQRDLRAKMTEWQRAKEAEFTTREAQLQKQQAQAEAQLAQRLAAEKEKLSTELQARLRKELEGDYGNQLRLLQEANLANEAKLAEARKQELEYLRREQDLLTKEKELEINLQKMLLEERGKLQEQVRQEESQRMAMKENEFQLKLKEMEEKLDSQKKLAEEMKRKAEQGSMQTQGEVQELLLEEMLKSAFPFDSVSEVGKGVRGADCTLLVHNRVGQPCGTIIFESKRTQHFSADWIEKLKADMRSQNADMAVLVTSALPKDMDRFGQRDGVWICSFGEVKPLVVALREGIIKVAAALKSQENKGDKMTMLYDYLTGNEFTEQWRAIREGFLTMRQSVVKEREQMEKLWKAREKQLDKVLLNLAGFKGSIEGIAGSDVEVALLDIGDENMLEE